MEWDGFLMREAVLLARGVIVFNKTLESALNAEFIELTSELKGISCLCKFFNL